jgi:hypothetical protein
MPEPRLVVDFTLLPEIRVRMLRLEEPFLTYAGLVDGHGIPGVDLMLMQEKLKPELFRSYMEATRELKRLEDTPNANTETPTAVAVGSQSEAS